MNYPIPASAEEILALRNCPVDEELIATAIAGVVKLARHNGLSLEELIAQVLQDDSVLDRVQRKWLSDLVTRAWEIVP
jgi:hypothetical protein